MTVKKSYNRFFIIFQEEDKGYGIAIDKQPTGYAKIEVRNGKCKITVYAQNLKHEKGPYYFHMMDTTKTPALVLKMGEVRIDESGKGETWWEYNEDNIKDSKCPVDKFNVAAIMVDGSELVSPLAGYTGKDKVMWKDKMQIKENEHIDESVPVEDMRDMAPEADMPDEVQIEMDEEALKFKEYEERIRNDVKADEEEFELENKRGMNNPEEMVEETPVPEQDNSAVERGSFEVEESYPQRKSERYYPQMEIDEMQEYETEFMNMNMIRHEDHKHKRKGPHAEIFHDMLSQFEEVHGIFDDGDKEDCGCRWWKIPHSYNIPRVESKYYPYLCTIFHLKMIYPYINYIKYFAHTGYYYFGMKYDDKGEVKHLMYGIKGGNKMKEQPYMGMTGFTKWMPLGNQHDDGMWIMFYNPYTGNVMVERNE